MSTERSSDSDSPSEVTDHHRASGVQQEEGGASPGAKSALSSASPDSQDSQASAPTRSVLPVSRSPTEPRSASGGQEQRRLMRLENGPERPASPGEDEDSPRRASPTSQPTEGSILSNRSSPSPRVVVGKERAEDNQRLPDSRSIVSDTTPESPTGRQQDNTNGNLTSPSMRSQLSDITEPRRHYHQSALTPPDNDGQGLTDPLSPEFRDQSWLVPNTRIDGGRKGGVKEQTSIDWSPVEERSPTSAESPISPTEKESRMTGEEGQGLERQEQAPGETRSIQEQKSQQQRQRNVESGSQQSSLSTTRRSQQQREESPKLSPLREQETGHSPTPGTSSATSGPSQTSPKVFRIRAVGESARLRRAAELRRQQTQRSQESGPRNETTTTAAASPKLVRRGSRRSRQTSVKSRPGSVVSPTASQRSSATQGLPHRRRSPLRGSGEKKSTRTIGTTQTTGSQRCQACGRSLGSEDQQRSQRSPVTHTSLEDTTTRLTRRQPEQQQQPKRQRRRRTILRLRVMSPKSPLSRRRKARPAAAVAAEPPAAAPQATRRRRVNLRRSNQTASTRSSRSSGGRSNKRSRRSTGSGRGSAANRRGAGNRRRNRSSSSSGSRSRSRRSSKASKKSKSSSKRSRRRGQ